MAIWGTYLLKLGSHADLQNKPSGDVGDVGDVGEVGDVGDGDIGIIFEPQ